MTITSQKTSPNTARTDARHLASVIAPRLLTDGGAVIFLIVLIVGFSIALPDRFPTLGNVQLLLGSYAIPLILALAVTLPLIAGEFDLSVGGTLGIAAVFSAYTVSNGWPVALVFIGSISIGILVGIVNGFLVTRLQVSAFIATLGMGTVLAGGNLLMTQGQVIYEGIDSSFTDISGAPFLALSRVTFYAFAVALVLWYLIEQTPFGRYLRATGAGREAARLTGVKTSQTLFLSFVLAGAFAALAGFLQASRAGSAAPDVGPSFLLPAYAAAFLGATTILPGRFNVWGTVVGVAILAVGITGLNLAGSALWVPDVFNGAALILAVAVSAAVRRRRRDDKS